MLNPFCSSLDPKDPLFQFREKGRSRLEEIGLPRLKTEAFHYLASSSRMKPFWGPFEKWTCPVLAERKQNLNQSQSGITFVDGFFEETLSEIPPDLVCLPLENAIRSYGLFLSARMNKLLKEETDPFAILNARCQGRGAFLYLPPKCTAVLQLNHIFTAGDLSSPRLHIYLGRGAKLELKQISQGQKGHSNVLIDLVLDEGATCHFADAMEADFQALRATLKKDSYFKAVFLGKTFRHSIKVQLTEENAEAKILGLARLQDEEQHIHALLEHMAPFTRSRQHFKSVSFGASRFSFEGKIYVHPVAQKTESYQLNNNLILSDEAIANAKPNLEIFADDVKASHGATFGRLDEEELFYLRSRGLDLETARQWLIEGFCKEILDEK